MPGPAGADTSPATRALEHGEWLALLLEREGTLRRQKRFESRARAAKLRHDAQVENTDFRAVRGLDRGLFLKLAGCDFIRERHGLLLTGPAGVGKSWLACALGQKACREDFSVAYHRAPRLFAALGLARGDGRYARMLKALARVDLLILDDWGPEKLNDDQRRDLLEIVEEAQRRRCPIFRVYPPVTRDGPGTTPDALGASRCHGLLADQHRDGQRYLTRSVPRSVGQAIFLCRRATRAALHSEFRRQRNRARPLG